MSVLTSSVAAVICAVLTAAFCLGTLVSWMIS